MDTYLTKSDTEKYILAGVEAEGGLFSAEESLEELNELVLTSGGISAERILQKRERPHPGHYLGKGKLDELRGLISLHQASGIVCDDELSNIQIRNLSDILDIKVIDRTLLILDIFANQAKSAEGKAQVELAQQKYRLSHLTGIGKSLSRLGGGIGTRGPGEKKLETDRRHIRRRISELEEELKAIEVQRSVQRERRIKNARPIISLVGYTNAGKSTLMNRITQAGVFESGKLFATLDTTTRGFELTGGSSALLSDTVGFIHKLPPGLIKAFRSTLAELKFSDIILHVVDGSNPLRSQHMKVVYETLSTLECMDKPIVTFLNKSDLEAELPKPIDNYASKVIYGSAKTGDNVDLLLNECEAQIKALSKLAEFLIPYSEGSLMNRLRDSSEIVEEEFTPEGIKVKAYVNEEIYNRAKNYSIS